MTVVLGLQHVDDPGSERRNRHVVTVLPQDLVTTWMGDEIRELEARHVRGLLLDLELTARQRTCELVGRREVGALLNEAGERLLQPLVLLAAAGLREDVPR